MRTITEYKEFLENEIIENNVSLSDIQVLAQKFTRKGFNALRIVNLFNNDEGSVTVENIENYELAGIFLVMYKITHEDEKWNPKDLPNIALETFAKGVVKVESENILEIDNVVQISDNAFLCPLWSLEEIFNARIKSQIRYNFDTQRESKYETTKKGKSKRVATINMKSVNEIANSLLKGTYGIPDMITLNVPVYPDKEPKFLFENGKVIIEIDNNFMSDTFTVIDSVDGEHRQLAVVKAFMKARKEGRKLNGGFPVMITLQTIEEARNFIARKAKGNPISREYTKAIETTDYTSLIDEINDREGLLQNNIALTYEEMNRNKKLTHRMVLTEAMKYANLEVNSVGRRVQFKKAFERVLNVVEDLMKDNEYNKFKDKYLACNTFAGYVIIADYVIKNKKDDEWILDAFTAINLLFDDEDDRLRLRSKQIDLYLKRIIGKTFKGLCEKLN